MIKFNHQLMAEDMAAHGWSPAELARRAAVADMTVYRFLDGTSQTAATAKKLADALGYTVRRYFDKPAVSTATTSEAVDDGQLALPLPRTAVSR